MSNPISLLQEIAASKYKRVPEYEYEIVAIQLFKCKVALGDMFKEAQASNKKRAKTLAAQALLQELGVQFHPKKIKIEQTDTLCDQDKVPIQSSSITSNQGTFTSEDCLQNHDLVPVSIPSANMLSSVNPSTSETESPPFHNQVSTAISMLAEVMEASNSTVTYELIACSDLSEYIYYYEVITSKGTAVGSGSTEIEAKENAAAALLDILRIEYKQSEQENNSKNTEHMNSTEMEYVDGQDTQLIDDNDNAVGKLITLCQVSHIVDVPKYKVIMEKGEPHCKLFVMCCTVAKLSVECSAKTKKGAKQLCAKKMLGVLTENLKKLTPDVPVSKLDIKNGNADAWDKLAETGVRNEHNANVSVNNIPFKDYLDLFDRNTYGKSKSLQNLKSQDISFIYDLPDPGHTFRTIVEELSIKYEISVFDSKQGHHVLNLLLKCKPNWSFMENATTCEEAKTKVYLAALEFMHTM